MRAGSITFTCASHSAAIASASGAVGAGERAANRRPDRLAVEQQREAARPGLADMRPGVETLTQCRARAAPRRLARIERLVFEDLGENVAHQNYVIVRRSKGSGAAGPWAAGIAENSRLDG